MNGHGIVSFAAANYHVARWLAGQTVRISIEGELVSFHHRGVLVAHVCSHPRPGSRTCRALVRSRAVSPANAKRTVLTIPSRQSSDAVTRKVDTTGSISFAAASYRVGSAYARKQVQVAIVDDQIQIAFEGELVRTHPIRHDPTRQHGALANPAGRPNRINAA